MPLCPRGWRLFGRIIEDTPPLKHPSEMTVLYRIWGALNCSIIIIYNFYYIILLFIMPRGASISDSFQPHGVLRRREDLLCVF